MKKMKTFISLVIIITLSVTSIPLNEIVSFANEDSTILNSSTIVNLDKLKNAFIESTDSDNDGLSDKVEKIINTNINSKDTDNDGLSDLFEAENNLDPLKEDTNDDGLSDLYELTKGDSNIEINADLVKRDTDNDSIYNVFDNDNDNDGVNDALDISPFKYIKDSDKQNMTITTSGNETFITIQIQPSDVDKLYESNKIMSWPKDNYGSVRNYDSSDGGVSIVPMLEVTMDDYPNEEDRLKFGYALVDDKLWVPLQRIVQDGEFIALEAKVLIPEKAGKKSHDNYVVDLEYKLLWTTMMENDNINKNWSNSGLVVYKDKPVSFTMAALNNKQFITSQIENVNNNLIPDLIIYYIENKTIYSSKEKYSSIEKMIYYDLELEDNVYVAKSFKEGRSYVYYNDNEILTDYGLINLDYDKSKYDVYDGNFSANFENNKYIMNVFSGKNSLDSNIKSYPKINNIDNRMFSISEHDFFKVYDDEYRSYLRDSYIKYDKERDTIWMLIKLYNPETEKNEIFLLKNYKSGSSYVTKSKKIIDNLESDFIWNKYNKGLSFDFGKINDYENEIMILTDGTGEMYIDKNIFNNNWGEELIKIPLKLDRENEFSSNVEFLDFNNDELKDLVAVQGIKSKNSLKFKVSIKDNINANNITLINEYDNFKVIGIQIEEKNGIETAIIHGNNTEELLKMNLAFERLYMNGNIDIDSLIEEYKENALENEDDISVISGKYKYLLEATMDIAGKINADISPLYNIPKPITVLTYEENKYLNLDELSNQDNDFNMSEVEVVGLKNMTMQWVKNGKLLDQNEINKLVIDNNENILSFKGNSESIKEIQEIIAHLNIGLSSITKIGDVEKELPKDEELMVYMYLKSPEITVKGINKVFVSKPIQTIGNVGWKYEASLAKYNKFTKVKSGLNGIGMILGVAFAIHSGYLYGKDMAAAGGTTFGVLGGMTYGILIMLNAYVYSLLISAGPVGWVIIAILVVDTALAYFLDDYNGCVNNAIASIMGFLFNVEKYPGTYINKFKIIDQEIEIKNASSNRLVIGSSINSDNTYLIRVRAVTKSTPANKESILEKGYVNYYSWNNSGDVNVSNDKNRDLLETFKKYGYWYEDKQYTFNNDFIFNKAGKNLKVTNKTKLETKLVDEVTYTSYVGGIYEDVEYEWSKETNRTSDNSYYDILPDNFSALFKIVDDFGMKFYDHDGDGLITSGDKELDVNGNIVNSDPYKTDTDNDGVDDYIEVLKNMNPRSKDTDNDKLEDKLELIIGTNPLEKDTDEDGLSDFMEYNNENVITININGTKIDMIVKTNPLLKDTDGDGLDDATELMMKSNPASKHTNGQDLYDGNEYAPIIIKGIMDINDVVENQIIEIDLYNHFKDMDNDELLFTTNHGEINKEGIFTFKYDSDNNGKVVEILIEGNDLKDGVITTSFIIEDSTNPYIKEVSTYNEELIIAKITTDFEEKLLSNSEFEIKFNQNVNLVNENKIKIIAINNNKLDIDENGNALSNDVIVNYNSNTIKVRRVSPLIENSIDYKLIIPKECIKDFGGNILEKDYELLFTTKDTIKPKLISSSPYVDFNTPLVLEFNEDIELMNNSIYVLDSNDKKRSIIVDINNNREIKSQITENILMSNNIYEYILNTIKVSDLSGNVWDKVVNNQTKSFITGDVAGPITTLDKIRMFSKEFYKFDKESKTIKIPFNEKIFEGKEFNNIILSYDRSLALWDGIKDELFRDAIIKHQLEKDIEIVGNELIITPKEEMPVLKDKNGDAIGIEMSYSVFIPEEAIIDHLGSPIMSDWSNKELNDKKLGEDTLYLKVYANEVNANPPKLLSITTMVENDISEYANLLFKSYTSNNLVNPNKFVVAIFDKDVIVKPPNYLNKIEIWEVNNQDEKIQKLRIKPYLPTQTLLGMGSFALVIELDKGLEKNKRYKFILPEGLIQSAKGFEDVEGILPNEMPETMPENLPENNPFGMLLNNELVCLNNSFAFGGYTPPSSTPSVPSVPSVPGNIPNLPDETPELPEGYVIPTIPEGMTIEEFEAKTVNEYQEVIFITNDVNIEIADGIEFDENSFVGLVKENEKIFVKDDFKKYMDMVNGTVEYQWLRSNDSKKEHATEILNANNIYYISTKEDVGKYLFLKLMLNYPIKENKEFVSIPIGPVERALNDICDISSISIKVDGKEMVTDFDKEKNIYNLTVPLNVNKVIIKVEYDKLLNDKLEINGILSDEFLEDGSLEIPIEFGENIINITSIAENFIDSNDYLIKIKREKQFESDGDLILPEVSKVEILNMDDFYTGMTLKGSYKIIDELDRKEISTEIIWYRQDDLEGLNRVKIDNSNSLNYLLTSEDISKFISFEIKPKVENVDFGELKKSVIVGPIKKIDNLTSTLKNIKVLVNGENKLSNFSINNKRYIIPIDDTEDSKVEVIVEGGEFVLINNDSVSKMIIDLNTTGVIEIESQVLETDLKTSYFINLSALSNAVKINFDNISKFENLVSLKVNVINQYDERIFNEIKWTIPDEIDYYITGDNNEEIVLNIKEGMEKETFKIKATLKNKEYISNIIDVNLSEIVDEDDITIFDDVNVENWYYDAVNYLANNNIINGSGNNQFNPLNNITRADFLIMVMRSYNFEIKSNLSDNFTDAGNKYYSDYLATAKELGIVSGVGNNRFLPESNVTREDMIVILYRILLKIDKLPNEEIYNFDEFNDINEINSYALEAMEVFVKSGKIKGNNRLLMPKNNSLRAEAAQFLFNLIIN